MALTIAGITLNTLALVFGLYSGNQFSVTAGAVGLLLNSYTLVPHNPEPLPRIDPNHRRRFYVCFALSGLAALIVMPISIHLILHWSNLIEIYGFGPILVFCAVSTSIMLAFVSNLLRWHVGQFS